MHATLSHRGNRPTNKQTHTQTHRQEQLQLRRLRFSSDADIVRLTNARIIIIIIIIIIMQ